MAIIGKIRKHSGLAVIIVGIAIAAFVIGDFGKRRVRGTNDIGIVDGEAIPYLDFSNKVEENIAAQKENTGNDKITDAETYNIRQSTWNAMVKELVLGKEYAQLGLAVSPEELFDQVQGRNPHRYILQYFKDPKTGMYDPAAVLNFLKNLDRMEPKAKQQWLQFEKLIKEDRQETKLNNLVSKAYYIPKAFLKKEFIKETQSLKIRFINPPLTAIPDSAVKLTDADFQKFYDENKVYFFQDEALRDIDFVVFDVAPSDQDRKKIASDVVQLYQDFQASNDIPNFTNANSDKKYDSNYVSKGVLPGILDSLVFISKPETYFEPFEFNNAWYMAKLQDVMDRPDSIKASQILISYQGTRLSDKITRTKEQAKKLADSLLDAMKKSPPERFVEFARTFSDYPTAKEDGGDLKWIPDGNVNFGLFFNKAVDMNTNDMKVVETGIGYAILKVTDKTKPVRKVKIALIQRLIEPSSQTFQDIYLKASAFAGQNKTPEAFEQAANQQGLAKRNAPGIREMDNNLMGLPSAREVVRWSFAETTKVGEVSPVFDLTGKYVVALLKNIYEKGQQPLEKVKDRIASSVMNMKKIEMLADRLSRAMQSTKDINALAAQFDTKVDTTILTFTGYSRSTIGKEYSLIGRLFNVKKGEIAEPMKGKFGVFVVILDDVIESPPKEDFTYERNQLIQMVSSRVSGSLYRTLEKATEIQDNRARFY